MIVVTSDTVLIVCGRHYTRQATAGCSKIEDMRKGDMILTSALSVQDTCTTPTGHNLVNSASKFVNLLRSSKKLKYFNVNLTGSVESTLLRGIRAATARRTEALAWLECVRVLREMMTERSTGVSIDDEDFLLDESIRLA